MRVTTIRGGIFLALIALAGEPAAHAAGPAATHKAEGTQDSALMLLSGASLLAAARLLRRYVP